NDGLVAVLHPSSPGHDHARVPPTRRPNPVALLRKLIRVIRTGWKSVRRYISKCTLRALGVDNVLDEFLRKRSHVEVIASSSPENCRIAHPAQTFIALRTIRGDAQKITSLPPQANRPHLIHQRTRRRQLSCRISTHAAPDLSPDRVQTGRTRIPCDLHVAESVES